MDEEPYGPAEGAVPGPAPAGPGFEESGFDLLGLDLESLRTVDHPVLSALADDLRERIAAPGSEALWGFDNYI